VYVPMPLDYARHTNRLRGVGKEYWHVILGRAISGIGSAGKIALTSIVVAGKSSISSILAKYH
jgi:hypothetical protein